jgi:3-hydroxyacyl-CoA dehydrogenase/enoyl-CoA hydratase/3-hydroxybutyryl-CoA epimerase/enoyl-CoA isomerase
MGDSTVPSEAALRLDVQDGVAIVTFDLPGARANTLGRAVFEEFEQLVRTLSSRTDLRGLILRSGKPGMFIAGADIKEIGGGHVDADAVRKIAKRGHDLVASFESLPFPTVAAIDGSCMGGGLELALGCDYRLAGTNPKTEIGLPEVKIGILPGWGGTQRLPRVIGPSLAAEMICSGEPAKADRAKNIHLILDVVPSDRLIPEAMRVIAWANETGEWKKLRHRKQQPVGLTEEQAMFAFAVARAQVQAKAGKDYPAPLAALTAIEKGCNQSLEDGLKVETEAFVPLVGSPVSRNLIAVFFMTQRLAKDPGVSDDKVQPRAVNQVGVIGAGIMGGGIAGACVRRGVPALITDTFPAAVEKGVTNIAKSMQGRVEAGKMAPADMAGALARLSTSMTLAALADRDVVIEAVTEDEKVKVKLFAEIEKVLPPGGTLASNTSTISITRMAREIKHPENFAGMHFFNPVERMQLVEVIRGEKTSDATVATLVALGKRIGKTPIVVRDCPGFLVNRILFPYLNEALVMLEEGAAPRALDKAGLAFGMPMGPITLEDVVGLDTSLLAGNVVNTAFTDRSAKTKILDELVAAKRFGQKSGAGFYSYAKGPRGIDDPALTPFLEKVRKGNRELSGEEMTDRLFLPMLTEASRLLEEGIVRDPADVDMGLILGIGFPPFRGGILRWADDLGLPAVVEKLKKYESLGKRFSPTEQIRRLAAERKGFYKA